MSFWKKLFGGGEEPAQAQAKSLDYGGFVVRATPFKQNERYQVCGVITRNVDGVVKEETFIRADSFTLLDDAVETTFAKARQIIDSNGAELPR